ncbi:hypothetical protein [Sorangium sp. So ce1389]|uniref:hypothetical protein n=1 Tax=Sorangium sp. So ce1389 TaxID=3133336 RepID=UPI003F607477
MLVFETAAAAAAYMEPIDVRNGEYLVVFDSEGRKLGIEVGFESRPGMVGLLARRIEVVRLVPLDDRPDEAELASLLRSFLADVDGRHELAAEASLAELIRRTADVALTR